MNEPHFILSFLPFWAVVYGFAVIAWTCIGRFLLAPFAARNPGNYIWRAFCALTDWWLAIVRTVTPLYILPAFHPLLGALWAFGLRFVLALAMLALGLAPRVSQMQGG